MPFAIPFIGAVFLAVMALLILWGVEALARTISHILRQVPAIGGKIADLFDTVAAGAVWTIQNIMSHFIEPLVGFFVNPVLSFLHWVSQVGNFMSTVTSWIAWTVDHTVPWLVRTAQSLATAAEARAVAFARTVYTAAINAAHAVLVGAEHYALSLYNSAIRYTRDLAGSIKAEALAAAAAASALALRYYNTAITYVRDLVHAVSLDLAAQVTRLEALIKASAGVSLAYVQAAIGQAVTSARALAAQDAQAAIRAESVAVAAGLATVWPDIVDEAKALDGIIATDLPDIGAAIRAIPTDIPLTDVAAIAAVGATTLPLLRYMRECGVPNCRNLSKYGRDLQDLLHAVEAGGLLALFAAMVTDPEGTAGEVSDVLGPIAHGSVDAAKSLLGVG